MKVFTYTWTDTSGEKMLAQVYGLNETDARKSLFLNSEERLTVKLKRTDPAILPSVGEMKFFGSLDEYLADPEVV